MKALMMCLTMAATAAMAADWPQFGGLNRDQVSAETGLADSWPEAGPKVLWEAAVHDGYSGAAIVGGKAYLSDREGENSLLRCLDMASGKELWKVSFSDPGTLSSKRYDGTRGTPTITDDAAFLVTSYGTFARVDLKAKKVSWKHHLVTDFDHELHKFGIAQSPALHGEMVLVAPNTPDVGVAAYNAKTGKRLWTSPGLGFHAYISPRVETVRGREMVIAEGSSEKAARSRRGASAETKVLAPGHVVGLSLDDGSILWDYTGFRCHGAIPHPVALSDNRFFITGGYGAGSAMIQIVEKDGKYEPRELFKTDAVGAQIHQPILVDGHLFIGSNSNSRKDGLAVLSLAGEMLWRTKDIDGAPNFERGPFILADGKLVILDGKTGILHLAKANPKKFELLASAKMVEPNDMAWAPLALSDGKLLVRDWNTLKCVDLK